MHRLARLLIREHLRRLNLHYGWAGYLSSAAVLVMFGWAGAAAAASYVQQASVGQLDAFLTSLWVVWILAAVVTGRDLSWRILPGRILAWPTPGFPQLYALVFLLGFLSLPLLVFVLIVEFWSYLRAGFAFSSMSAVLAGGGLFVASVRLIASSARISAGRKSHLSGSLGSVAVLPVLLLSVCYGAAVLSPAFRALLPGHQLALLLSGSKACSPLLHMGVVAALFVLVDYPLQRDVTYSGIRGPLAPAARTMSRGQLLLIHPGWPGPLFRIALLGWLRTRNALLLLIWGGMYSFFYTYFSRPDESFYFHAFVWMNLLYHSYLRGNLLGIDLGGVWLYYMLPVRIGSALSAKSLSLSFLQTCMITALLATGVLRAEPQLVAAEWIGVLIYTVSSILLGEICGIVFSVLYPDPIDRNSQFSGGMTSGALAIPAIQLLLLAAFLMLSTLTDRVLPPAVHWCLLLAVPAALFIVRIVFIPMWSGGAMVERQEIILKKLSVYSL